MSELNLFDEDKAQAVKDFIALVAEMRENQKQYFLTRSRRFLNKSKELETRVDKALAWFGEQKGGDAV
ncbi:MAG: hypothetical protein IJM68_00830 [Synergistaceae bacterium]|nr:hypothetical protein [Synergistaceae bacterium]